MTGQVRAQNDGSGSFHPEGGGRPVHVPPEEMRGLKHGESVTMRVEAGRKGRMHAHLVQRGRRAGKTVVGVLRRHGRRLYVSPIPDGPAVGVPAEELGDAQEGDAVVLTIAQEAKGTTWAKGRVERVLGDADLPGVQVEMAIWSSDVPMQFPEAALAQARAAKPVDVEVELEEARKDLRDVLHMTIDGADARDFDDAVAAREEEEGIRVWVSIADVSHYVTPDSALDKSARERATSVYFPHRAIPMLPEELSNDLCSLKPNVVRPTLTCEMRVRPDGKVEDERVYPSLIESHARRIYEDVQKQLETPPQEEPADVSLRALQRAALALRKRRAGRGSLDLDFPEPYFVVDNTGHAKNVRARERLEAHRLIEDLMIAANEAVARLCIKKRIPTVFRIHDSPDPVRLEAFGAWAAYRGLEWDADAAGTPQGLAAVARTLRDGPGAEATQTFLLRSLPQAVYSTENRGHFGLASKAYVHFTSPIRRYPDLLVHRALRAHWKHEPNLRELSELAAHSSTCERRAVDAERRVTAMMASHVAAERLGQTYDAVVMGVHTVGAFVRPQGLFVDGLVPIAAFGAKDDDYYDYIQDEQVLMARRSGAKIGLGSEIEVVVSSVDPFKGRVNFELTGVSRTPRRRRDFAPKPSADKPTSRRKPKRGTASKSSRKSTKRKTKPKNKRRR